MARTTWFRNYLTLIGAVFFTLLLGYLAFLGKIPPSRVTLTLAFVWVLALHSQDVNEHKREMITALALLARAGEEKRRGEAGKCAADLELAAGVVVEVVEEIATKKTVTQVQPPDSGKATT